MATFVARDDTRVAWGTAVVAGIMLIAVLGLAISPV